ncbi:hypothetical protein ASPZODRAFT_147766 [Penicilliopsis zonata CBS 506.65]|uniref:Terpenoid synthase n=1 Tax=Penicilliopsis zonata CBS 506.65 TaxID=1073090 RepID=A0A1L9S4L9_9EURO|nr:hypothetical protein ASPZODRAFT_147766 [Penicilliopsis zonata CBS 506.65]OJJ42098.1 hypothetical protein ASPZODRAFT_147766 [Penicilliopsis zonata CBS 506.65]
MEHDSEKSLKEFILNVLDSDDQGEYSSDESLPLAATPVDEPYAISVDEVHPEETDLYSEAVRQCGRLFSILLQLREYYNDYTYMMMVKATFAFIASTFAEQRFLTQSKGLPVDSLRDQRDDSGFGLFFVLALFPREYGILPKENMPVIRMMVDYANDANDVLSYYKESIVGDEPASAFILYSQSSGVSRAEALQQYINLSKRDIQRMEEYGCSAKIKKIMRRFIYSYVRWHVDSPRYQLDEILGDAGVYEGNPTRGP